MIRGKTYTRSTCRLCKSTRLWKAIPLSPLPIASPNVGGAAQVYESAPADVYQCEDCGFLQLNTIVDPEFQYRNFRYVTAISAGLREHFSTLIDTLARQGEIGPGKFVFDIGSNDGSLLALVKKHGARVLGIDPAREIAERASEAGIPTIGEFFTTAMGRKIASEHGRADVIFSNNTIGNIDDLDDMFGGIAAVLAPNGLLIIETQYAIDVLEKSLLDVIYHEHISYFSVSPMRRFLAARGLELFDAERIAPKGGSIRFYVQHRGGPRPVSGRVNELIAAEQRDRGIADKSAFRAFNERVVETGSQIRQRLELSRARTGQAFVYGSSVGCVALIQYLGLGNMIDAVFDDKPLTDSVISSTGVIPVLNGRELVEQPATDIAVLAWRYAHDIAARQAAYRAKGGRFYRALPDLAFVD